MKNKCIFCVACILWVCSGFNVSAQSASSQGERRTTAADTLGTADMLGAANTPATAERAQRIMLARSSAEYRVTPGDVYMLAYAAGTTPVSYVITVDTSYRIRVANLGLVNGAGKTFMQLKSEVETVVSNNYPLSGVQLVLTEPAVFRVYVNGEVREAKEISAWGLSRLSVLTEENLTDYASVRDISVKSTNGQTKVYDLFKALRLGDMTQDPYLRPGDVITFNRIKRLVTVNGEVERPGVYQLLEGENIKDLIEFYGNGFTPIADRTRLEMVRLVNGTDIAGDKIFLAENDFVNNYVLEYYDVITVPEITQLRPVMFVEGALSTGITADLVSTTRMTMQFNSGDTYASMVRRYAYWFTPVSDTQNAYILRKNERIPINLNSMLYDASYRDDLFLQKDDVLIIPFRQYFITVAGAVLRPGRYPYIPDRDWEYYIALAGGFIMERNSREVIKITDITGKQLKKTDAITPETTITASTNHLLYYFNQYAPIVITILTAISTILTIQVYAK
jgi:protein involved in polysaccharide export with SLBB domain